MVEWQVEAMTAAVIRIKSGVLVESDIPRGEERYTVHHETQ
jgi:hypothetical protein